MQKTCKHCQNHFPEEEHENHELSCAVNPDVQEKARKIGEVELYKKTAVIENHEVVRMYWAHSTGAEDFPIEPIFERWLELYPETDLHSVPFLQARGFNVVIT